MKNQVCKTIKCELRHSVFLKNLSSSRNAQSESDKHFSTTTFEQRWDMNENAKTVGSDSISD